MAKLPPIDVLVLGMGEDGHTASLFPDSPNTEAALDPRGVRRCLPMQAPSVPRQRLSMSLALLASARLTLLALHGPASWPRSTRPWPVNPMKRCRSAPSSPAPRNLLVPLRPQGIFYDIYPNPRRQHDDKIALIDQWCSAARILPVITIEREADILPLADALPPVASVLEITLRSALGLSAIRLLREQRPELIVGAGTVLDAAMLAQAEAAGAQFIVSPGSTGELLDAALHSPLPLLPGVASASEIMLGYALGYRRFKLFPAEVCGGVAALKALGGPFGNIRFCPTGGVNARNARDHGAVQCDVRWWYLDGRRQGRACWRLGRHRKRHTPGPAGAGQRSASRTAARLRLARRACRTARAVIRPTHRGGRGACRDHPDSLPEVS